MNTFRQSTCILFLLATLVLASTAYAQTQYSPKYRIAYDANGWDELSDKQIDKRSRKIERKFGPSVSSDWRFQAQRLKRFGYWIDEEWEKRILIWSRCYDTSRLNPDRIFITVESDTFRLPAYPELSSIWGTVDFSGRIRLTAWAFIPNRQWCVNAVDTLGWELGNFYQLSFLGAPNDPYKEIGNNDPCR